MPLADTLLRLAEPPGLFHARWTDEILGELSRTLTTKLRCSSEQARSRLAAMRQHFPSALVRGHEALIARMPNDPKDRHVLAAAVRSGADYVVTFNLKDFPPSLTRPLGVNAIGPGAFLRELWGNEEEELRDRLRDQAQSIGIPEPLLLSRLSRLVPGFVKSIAP